MVWSMMEHVFLFLWERKSCRWLIDVYNLNPCEEYILFYVFWWRQIFQCFSKLFLESMQIFSSLCCELTKTRESNVFRFIFVINLQLQSWLYSSMCIQLNWFLGLINYYNPSCIQWIIYVKYNGLWYVKLCIPKWWW